MTQAQYFQAITSAIATLKAFRFVVIDPTTRIATYCPANQRPTHVTIGDAANYRIACLRLDITLETFKFYAEGTIAALGNVSVGSDGKGIAASAATGYVVCRTVTATVADSWGSGFILPQFGILCPTAGAIGAHLFCTLTAGTKAIALTAEDAAPTHISLAASISDVIAVASLADKNREYPFLAGGTIAQFVEIEVGADGKGVTVNGNGISLFTGIATTAGSYGTTFAV